MQKLKILLKKKMTVLKKIVGVFPSNFVNRYISFHKLMKKEHAKYPFIILNTGRAGQKGTGWWCI